MSVMRCASNAPGLPGLSPMRHAGGSISRGYAPTLPRGRRFSMIGALRDFVRRLNAAPDAHFEGDDQRLALAALLVHCMEIDGAVSANEQAMLRAVLARSFGLDEGDLEALIHETR